MVSVQGAPASVTVKMLPAIVSVPVRALAALFAAALKLTVPLPDPLAPAVTVIHPLLLAAVHAHPAGAFTVAVPVPPPEPMLCAEGEIVSVQTTPACVTVKVAPAIVSVPVRAAVDVLPATLNATVPFPVPAAPAVTVIQEALLEAVHAHPVPAVTEALPLPPAATTERPVGETAGTQPDVNAKVLETRLVADPDAPIVWMRAS